MENKTIEYKPVYGYKGLSKDMTSKGNNTAGKEEVFELGKIYYKDNVENPNLCSDQGYHFCRNLSDCFSYYRNDGENRFFKIEILGNITHEQEQGGKSITTAFRLVEEVDVKAIVAKEKAERGVRELDTDFKLPEVRFLQTKYPHLHVGGSVALFLHGLWLDRWRGGVGDIDMVTPFYTYFEGDDKSSNEGGHEVKNENAKASSNDFDQTFFINGTKVDVRIDPPQAYDLIEVDGFMYKVSRIETILEAKIRYSERNPKHRDDIHELVGKFGESYKTPLREVTLQDLYKRKEARVKALSVGRKEVALEDPWLWIEF